MSRSFACSVIRSSESIGRLVKSLIRVSSSLSALRNANAFSASVPSAAAGSAIPQCARHWLSWPDGTDLACGVVADGEDKIDRRRSRRCELIPALTAKALRRQIRAPQELERERMHLALGEASRAEGAKPALTQSVQERLGQDAARRVAGAQKKDVVGPLTVHFAQQLAGCGSLSRHAAFGRRNSRPGRSTRRG